MADEEVQEQEPQQEAQQEEGLVDSAQIAEPEVETPVEEPSHQEPTEDGKPDWLPDRFWNDENGADYEALAKSQDELYKKLRGGKHQAPEDGNYDLKFLNEAIPEDDELLTNFKKNICTALIFIYIYNDRIISRTRFYFLLSIFCIFFRYSIY